MTIGKKIIKISLRVLIIVIAFYILYYVLMLSSCSETEDFDNEADFEAKISEVDGASYHIPDTEKLGEYESITLKNKKTKYVLWSINTLSLTVKYNKENFEKEISSINSNYSFINEEKEGLYDYSASLNGYEIRIVEKDEKFKDDYCYYYPKYFLMIGINEEKQSIVYLYHYDIDLDKIDDLDDFIKKYYKLD